jgi:type IX secretion system PorP/SprF family membrane protein
MIKSRTYIITLILLVSAGLISLYGQQHPFYSQYMLDKFLVNPAIAGANGVTTINLISRQQFVGFEKPPQTFALSAQTRLIEDSFILKRLNLRKKDKKKSRSGRIGIGGSIFADRNGIVSRTGFQGTYAYHINISNAWQLSMGLSLQGYQFKVDDSESPYANPGDPLLAVKRKSFFVPDANAGVFLTNGILYGGVTMTDILGSSLKLGREISIDYKTQRKYNLIAGYRINLASNFILEPCVLVQGTRTNFSIDFSARVFYSDNYWAGISYRSNKSTVVMLGAKIDRFFLGYAYDIDMGPVKSYSAGSHELIIGLRLGDNNTRRFRWLKQSEQNYDI